MLTVLGWLAAWLFAGTTIVAWMAANRHLTLYRAEVAKHESVKKQLARVRDNEREAMSRLGESRQRERIAVNLLEALRLITPPCPDIPEIPAAAPAPTDDPWVTEMRARWAANDNTSEQ